MYFSEDQTGSYEIERNSNYDSQIKIRIEYSETEIKSKEKRLLLYTLIPVVCFLAIVYALGLAILANAVSSASIAKSNFVDSSASLVGILVGYIVVGALNFVYFIVFACIFLCGILLTQYIAILGISNLFFNVVTEGIFFKFAICFNYPTNDIVIARSCMVIILMLILIIIPFWLHYYRYINEDYDKIESNDGAFMKALFIIPCIGIIALNIALLVKLRPQLNYTIGPYNIQMGFFNSSEISLIQNGTYVKTNTFDDQLIGSLSDIIYSPDKVFVYKTCSSNGKGGQSCTERFMHNLTIQITCNQQSQQFFQDCANSNNLNIVMKYLDEGAFPTYNCMVNTSSSNTCSSCNKLLSNYNLYMIQQVNNQVQPAWTGLCSCSQNPNINLSQDGSIYVC